MRGVGSDADGQSKPTPGCSNSCEAGRALESLEEFQRNATGWGLSTEARQKHALLQAETKMNRHSSRSHAVFIVTVTNRATWPRNCHTSRPFLEPLMKQLYPKEWGMRQSNGAANTYTYCIYNPGRRDRRNSRIFRISIFYLKLLLVRAKNTFK